MNLNIEKNNKGFTLLELMIAMVIFVVVVALIADNYNSQQDQHVTQNQVVEIQQNVRAGFHMIINEIRMAGHDPYNNSGAEINENSVGDGSNGSPLEFTYYSDSNDDGDTDDAGEFRTVTIELDVSILDAGATPDCIYMSALPGKQPIAENIASLQFTYFDINGAQIAANASGNIPPSDVGDIQAIRIQLTARPDESERDLMAQSGGSNRTLNSMIKLRNI